MQLELFTVEQVDPRREYLQYNGALFPRVFGWQEEIATWLLKTGDYETEISAIPSILLHPFVAAQSGLVIYWEPNKHLIKKETFQRITNPDEHHTRKHGSRKAKTVDVFVEINLD